MLRRRIALLVFKLPHHEVQPMRSQLFKYKQYGFHSAAKCWFSSKGLPEHAVVKLPALSPTMEEGTIVNWVKNEGDSVAEGDVLAEAETDKATMAVESPEEGFLAKILVAAGTKNVKVGQPICILTSKAEDIPAFKSYVDSSSADVKEKSESQPAVSKAEKGGDKEKKEPASRDVQSTDENQSRIYTSPMAKRLASERNMRLKEGSKGSGLYESIKSKDLDKLEKEKPLAKDEGVEKKKEKVVVKDERVEKKKDVSRPAEGKPAGPREAAYKDLPVTGMRKVIAARLLESKQNIPHFYLTCEIVIDELEKMRFILNSELASAKVKLSLNDLVIKATALACINVPAANSSWRDTVIRQYSSVDVSVAVSTPGGLLTPIVFGAEKKSLSQISTEMKDLAAKARTNKLNPAEYQGGTVTVSNLGMMGITQFAGIINPPQACLLGVGTTQQRLFLKDTKKNIVESKKVMAVTLSCDHRVVDGAVGAQWLANFKSLLEKPEEMFKSTNPSKQE